MHIQVRCLQTHSNKTTLTLSNVSHKMKIEHCSVEAGLPLQVNSNVNFYVTKILF